MSRSTPTHYDDEETSDDDLLYFESRSVFLPRNRMSILAASVVGFGVIAAIIIAIEGPSLTAVTTTTSMTTTMLITTTSTTTTGACDPGRPMSTPVTPKVFGAADDVWRNRCVTENKGGHWITPEGVYPNRNFCWAAMKDFAQRSEYRDKTITPENWWWAQEQAFKKGQAPNPQTDPIQPLGHPELCDIPENGNDFGGQITDQERKEAREWFNRTVTVFVVNLDRSFLRMENIARRLTELGLPYERIAGIDLSQNGAYDKAVSDGYIPRTWDYQKMKENLWLMYGESNKPSIYDEVAGIGSVGCAAAHLKAMGEAEERSRKLGKPFAFILEDDVYLYDDFAVKLRRLLMNEAPCDWEAVSLKSYNPVGECISKHLSRVRPDGNEPRAVCRRAANWGFQSMLYRVSRLGFVRDTVARSVWDVERGTCLIQDIALASSSDSIKLYAVPACQRPGFLNFMKDPKGSKGVREQINR